MDQLAWERPALPTLASEPLVYRMPDLQCPRCPVIVDLPSPVMAEQICIDFLLVHFYCCDYNFPHIIVTWRLEASEHDQSVHWRPSGYESSTIRRKRREAETTEFVGMKIVKVRNFLLEVAQFAAVSLPNCTPRGASNMPDSQVSFCQSSSLKPASPS